MTSKSISPGGPNVANPQKEPMMNITHQSVNGTLLITQANKHYKFVFTHSSLNRYETELSMDDLILRCPMFQLYPQFIAKILQKSPTIHIDDSIMVRWIVTFLDEEQILSVELLLVPDDGINNRRLQLLSDRNNLLEQRIIMLERTNEELSRVVYQDYLIENMHRIFPIMTDEQKNMAVALFDFNDRDSKITQRLYERLMPADIHLLGNEMNRLNASINVCLKLSEHIDPNYPMELQNCGNWVYFQDRNYPHTFFMQILYHLVCYARDPISGIAHGYSEAQKFSGLSMRDRAEEHKRDAYSALVKLSHDILMLLVLLDMHIDNVKDLAVPHMVGSEHYEFKNIIKGFPQIVEYFHKEKIGKNPDQIICYDRAIRVLQKLCKTPCLSEK